MGDTREESGQSTLCIRAEMPLSCAMSVCRFKKKKKKKERKCLLSFQEKAMQ